VKLGCITINNKRPKVLHLWCASIKRLRESLGYFPVVCVSGAEDADICMKYSISHISQDNHPANKKWDTAMSYMSTTDIDYVLISGSDDLFSTQAIVNVIGAMDSLPDMIGFNSLYIYCATGNSKGRMKHITTKGIFGVGKTLSRGVLEDTNWRPWEYGIGRSWGMDAILARNTARYVKRRVMVEGVIVDVKTDESLNKFSMFEKNHIGGYVDKQLFYNILGDEEKQILANIEGRSPSLDTWIKGK